MLNSASRIPGLPPDLPRAPPEGFTKAPLVDYLGLSPVSLVAWLTNPTTRLRARMLRDRTFEGPNPRAIPRLRNQRDGYPWEIRVFLRQVVMSQPDVRALSRMPPKK